MANRLRGEVVIPGTDHVLRFTTNSICFLEDDLGRTIGDIAGSLQDEPDKASFKVIRSMVRAGLMHAQPKITAVEAGEVMDEAGFVVVVQVMSEALSAAFAGADDGEAPGTPGN